MPAAASIVVLFFQSEELGSARGSGEMALEKANPGSLEEWETVVGDDFSLYYDSYSVDERVDSDSKVRRSAAPCAGLPLQSFLPPPHSL